jgi:hypothetical protein
MSAAVRRQIVWLDGKRRIAGLALCFTALIPQSARAQHDVVPFLAGAALALGMHEAGHVVADVAFGAPPGVSKVSFGGIPFFAITHRTVSPGREFTISSAGFWVQHASDERLLAPARGLHGRHAPLMKGMLAFNILTSVGYSTAAFLGVGPLQRDTRGMALSADVPEPVIGGLILAPAALDAVRYIKPEMKWPVWASRAVKIGGAALVIKAARR